MFWVIMTAVFVYSEAIMTEERFVRNIGAVTPAEQQKLAGSRIFVAGCGGLGGYVLENLIRAGTGHIICADDGIFEQSNANRQLLCDDTAIGRKKADCARERAAKINPGIDITAVDTHVDNTTLPGLVEGCDLAMDATDNMRTRAELFMACRDKNIPIIFGAADGWNAAAAFVPPWGNLYDYLKAITPDRSSPASVSTLSFVPAFAASLQCALAIRFLCGRGCDTRLHIFDLQTLKQDIIEVDSG